MVVDPGYGIHDYMAVSRVHVVGVLVLRALLFGVYMKTPCFWNSHVCVLGAWAIGDGIVSSAGFTASKPSAIESSLNL